MVAAAQSFKEWPDWGPTAHLSLSPKMKPFVLSICIEARIPLSADTGVRLKEYFVTSPTE